jgi:serine/threonine protein kinase
MTGLTSDTTGRGMATLKSVSTQDVITKVVGEYHLLKQIGRGGMSVVSLALDGESNKLRAIKVVEKTGRDKEKNDVVVNSAITEANILESLDNYYLPKIYNIIETDDVIYVVMEYIEGKSLKEVIHAEGAQTEEDVIKWARQLCEALDYLHSRKSPIIYRDMKPSNIMLKLDGNIKLIDFGIAREYKTENSKDTMSLGTRGYAAPEQFDADTQSDERTDVYNLGATLYHIVTGMDPSKPPYVIKPIRRWNPSLSIELERIIAKSTNPDPALRYQSAREMLEDLTGIHSGDETAVLADDDETTMLEDEDMTTALMPDGDGQGSTPVSSIPNEAALATAAAGSKKKRRTIIISAAAAVAVLAGVLFINAAGGTGPADVTGLQGSAASLSDVSLAWDKSANADSYEIVITADENTFKKAGKAMPETPIKTAATEVTISGLVCDEEYTVSVTACAEKDGDTVRQKGAAAEAVVNIPPPDAAVATFTVSPSAFNAIALSWTPPDHGGADTLFSVMSSMASDGEFIQKYTGSDITYTDTDLAPETGYFYKVATTLKLDGKEFYGNSDVKSAVTLAPSLAVPKLKASAEGYSEIGLSWGDVNLVGGKTVYSLVRSEKESGKYNEIYGGGKVSFSDDGLDPETKYFYKVIAVCTIGGKEYRSESETVSAVTNARPVQTAQPTTTRKTRPPSGPVGTFD